MRVFISRENPATLYSTKRFFEIISGINEPIFLELIAEEDKIFWQIAAQERDTYLIKNALNFTNPNSVITEIENDIIQEYYDQIKYSEKRMNMNLIFGYIHHLLLLLENIKKLRIHSLMKVHFCSFFVIFFRV